MSNDQNGQELASKGGEHNLGYDEDGVEIAPWPCSTGPKLRDIKEMIAKLEDASFKVTEQTPNYDNPYRQFDGCCYHPLETKEKAFAHWNRRLEYRKAQIEEAQKNRKSDV